jgi:Skp family chaperone for outer membrane proteins
MRFFTLICCFFVASVVMARDFTVGIVDLQQLFKEYPGTKKAQKKFNAMADKKKQDLTDAAEELRDLEKQLKDSGSVLSKKEMKQKQDEYTTKARAFQDQENQIQTDLAGKEQEMTAALLGEIKEVVAKLAKKDGIDLVLDSEKTVYAKDATDLTAEVLKTYKDSDSSDSGK